MNMTREELKEHCEKQVERCKMWAKYRGEEPSGKIYEEHKLILELLEQESNVWSFDDAREDFVYDVYNALHFLLTNDEANRIIDSFDRVTSRIRKEPVLDKVREELIQSIQNGTLKIESGNEELFRILDKYRESEDK